MEDILEEVKRKLPHLSRIDAEVIRSIFLNYCCNKTQEEVFRITSPVGLNIDSRYTKRKLRKRNQG